MKRRQFSNYMGLSLLATCFPAVIAACTSDSSNTTSSTAETTTTKSAAQDWYKVGTVAELDKTGQILRENTPVDTVLVIGTSQTADQITAVNPTCTHKGCTVVWKSDQDSFVCPCHNAVFTTEGTVKGGPAEKPLKTYLTKIEGGSVLILLT
ncbi:MAG: Rieske (2Fe-2S) protein [Sphaerospermopsis sp. SIO1G2]|nr:Rieske (2Fe-2S) protein [Sphaerospermopsis sp. SIO1G2]